LLVKVFTSIAILSVLSKFPGTVPMPSANPYEPTGDPDEPRRRRTCHLSRWHVRGAPAPGITSSLSTSLDMRKRAQLSVSSI